MMAAKDARALDGLAVSLSGLCLVHCLLLPVFAASLPVWGAWARAEWVHWAFLVVAAPTSLGALLPGVRAGRGHGLVALAGLGLALLAAGALGWPAAAAEKPLSVAGGVLLACAHLLNWRRALHPHGVPSGSAP